MAGKPVIKDAFIKFLGICAGLAVLAGFVIIYYFFATIANFSVASTRGMEAMSIMGEFFGGTVGSIWALAGVILFFLALIYQRRELELQREELIETRMILKRQSETIEIQQFENTFFQLLNFHLEASKKIQANPDGNGFEKMYNDFKKSVNAVKRKRKADGSSPNLDEEAFENSFRNVFDGYKNTLSHYMESYKALLFFVTEKSKDPEFYLNIIKPHLSEQEVLIQFYYLLLFSKDKQWMRAVEKYGMFERLNPRSVQEVDKFHLDVLKKGAYA